VLWGAGLDAAIGINAMGFVQQRWIMLAPSILGGALGTWVGWEQERATPPTFK